MNEKNIVNLIIIEELKVFRHILSAVKHANRNDALNVFDREVTSLISQYDSKN